MRKDGRERDTGAERPAVAWAITGAGHFLRESIDIIGELAGGATVEVFLSRAASEVVAMYGVQERLASLASCVTNESGHSFPCSGRLSSGRYAALVVAPATSNSVSKFALGIADSLVTTLFAQGGKSRVPICVLPTDATGEIESITPGGKRIMVYPRSIDLQMTESLSSIDGVSLAATPAELRAWLGDLLNGERMS